MTTWRTSGSHWMLRQDIDGEWRWVICHCGPANALTGPQYAAPARPPD